MESVMDNLDEKYLFMECVKKPSGEYERKIFELTRRAGKSMIESVSDTRARQSEYREYIENWVHEIKAPITAARLACQNDKSALTRKLLVQLAQIEEHVERALYYARAESVEKDFIVRATPLSEIVADAVARHRVLLIENGMRVETSGLESIVYTDGKWAAFLLGQLLSNAARYKKEGVMDNYIRFEAEPDGNNIQLTVTDNGIGIPAADLPRVFERGFTGRNGRVRGNSTGMGLYVSKKLADFLQIAMEAESAENEFTRIRMAFPATVSHNRPPSR
jgi:signal transduction histidine kinase